VALDTFIAGRYSGTYAAVDVGITREGYEITLDTEIEEIGETDAWGQSVIDGIWRGGNCFLQFVSTAYKAGSLAAFWPYGGSIAAAGVLGILVDDSIAAPNKLPIGQLASNIAKAFVLTAAAGTPAATTPATLTANLALLARNFSGRLLYNSKLRDVPIRLRLFPYTVTNVTKFFAMT
jgi:hypothetical protein